MVILFPGRILRKTGQIPVFLPFFREPESLFNSR